MKKIFLMCAVASAALGFSSCNETWDDNPVLKGHEGTPTVAILNAPALQDQYILLTEDNKDGNILLTCSQPDYGYAAIATYKVQLSLTEDFARFEEISQSFYNCAEINPTNKDFASAFEKLHDIKTEDELDRVKDYQTVYVRLRSYIAQSPSNTEYLSNVVKFDKVAATYLAVWISGTPVDLFIRGGMNDWGGTETGPDGTPGPWQFVTGPDENTWIIDNVTIKANTSIKVSTATWKPINLGGNAGENDDSQMIKPGEEVAMTGGDNPGHMRMDVDFTGKVLLRLAGEVYYITFDPAKSE